MACTQKPLSFLRTRMWNFWPNFTDNAFLLNFLPRKEAPKECYICNLLLRISPHVLLQGPYRGKKYEYFTSVLGIRFLLMISSDTQLMKNQSFHKSSVFLLLNIKVINLFQHKSLFNNHLVPWISQVLSHTFPFREKNSGK